MLIIPLAAFDIVGYICGCVDLHTLLMLQAMDVILVFCARWTEKWDELGKGKNVLLMKHVRVYKKLFILERRVACFWFWQA
jgi:hypothetical protein